MVRQTLLTLALVLLALLQTAAAAPPDYGDTYTPEEMAAIERILWGGNMTLDDLHYKKDYTEGHACFPIVREMMNDPLMIAPWMDKWAARWEQSPSLVFGTLDMACDQFFSFSPEPVTSAETPRTTDSLVGLLVDTIQTVSDYPSRVEGIRDEITSAMAWHEFEPTREKTSYESAKADSDSSLFETLESNLSLGPFICLGTETWFGLQQTLASLNDHPQVFPPSKPEYFDTAVGRICIGTMGDDYYEGDFAVLIEPGGNDTYRNCRIGAAYGAPTPELGNGQVGYFADLGGDDFYDCADVNITLGAAVLGVAAFYDLGGGDDRYYAGSCSLGAAMGGIATFYDDGGSDYYSGKVYTQGAAGFGIGIMVDDAVGDAPEFDTAEGNEGVIDAHELDPTEPNVHSQMDNDYYTAWSESQAFARTRGVALCVNRRGNETYHAGGVYLHAPLFGDRYQSFSQGFAIGERGIDYAGGIAMLIDYDGNDRYLGDIYNQGVGYWYGAGLLWDGGGNDTYEMTQYGQGSGIHLAVGGLVDVSGNDSYIMHSGLGQGSSHDLAVSVLHDRGGNDRYHGNTTCNGAALTGSTGLFIDRSGNDTYAGRSKSSINYGDGRRTNAALFIDLDGQDDYMLAEGGDGVQWKQTNIGMGWDVDPNWDWTLGKVIMPPEDDETAATPAPADTTSDIPIPEICSYEGDLTQEVFDELWAISIRWAVGDNSTIVPFARKRLIDFGPAVLPYMSEVMDDSNSGLALRAFVEIYKAVWEEDSDGVASLLRDNAADMDDDVRRQNALYLVGELANIELEDIAVTMLDDQNPSHQRRAIGVLGKIGSHAGNERLLAMLEDPDTSEPYLSAAITTLTELEVDCYNQLAPLLDHDLFTVRELLIKQLVKHYERYGSAVEVLDTTASPRAVRSILATMLKGQTTPTWTQAVALADLVTHDDWGVRADAAKLVRRWQELADEDEMLIEQIVPAVVTLEEMLEIETDPFVLFSAGVE